MGTLKITEDFPHIAVMINPKSEFGLVEKLWFAQGTAFPHTVLL